MLGQGVIRTAAWAAAILGAVATAPLYLYAECSETRIRGGTYNECCNDTTCCWTVWEDQRDGSSVLIDKGCYQLPN